MSKARDNRKKNDRLNWSVRNNPAVAGQYPELAELLAASDAVKEARR